MIVKERFDDEIYLNYMRKEIRSDVASIEHGLIREAMRMTGVERGVEVTLLSDIPSEGSGPRLLEQLHGGPARTPSTPTAASR